MEEITCNCEAKLEIAVFGDFNERLLQQFGCPNCGELLNTNSKNAVRANDIVIVTIGIEIKPYDLNPSRVFEVLSGKGAAFLYHANTVLTSRTYIEQDMLLSREQVTKRGLEQTSQYTDDKDIRYGINDDIFMDVVDIHDRMSAINDYGPVLFEFPLTLLMDFPFKFVRITKMNPSDWSDKDLDKQRYYTSIEELKEGYNYGNFSSMLMFHHIKGELKLNGNLTRFIIDNPKLSWNGDEKSISDDAIDQFKLAKRESGMQSLRAKLRNCPDYCGCHNQYKIMHGPKIEKLFKVAPRLL